MKSKTISGVIALTYVITAYFGDGGATALKVAASLILPLACIWFSDEMGDYGGMLIPGGPMRRTPGYLVAAGGWLLLLMPAVVALVFALREEH